MTSFNINYIIPVLATLALAGTCSADTINIVNNDFSAVAITCGSGYAYQTLEAGGDCSGPSAPQQDLNSDPLTGWAFAGGSGLTGPSTAFNPPDFAGLFGQAAFLQGSGSSVSQSLDGFLDTEAYTASFYLGSRYSDVPNDGNQTVTVLIDDVVVDQYALTSSTPFSLITTDPFSVTAGSHTLTLAGSSDGDHTAFVSAVSVTSTPEPATLVLFGTGLIGVYCFGRRKRSA